MFARLYQPQRYPFIPAGGPFLMIIGAFIMVGAFLPARANSLTNLGFVVGGMSFAFSWKLMRGLPDPTWAQVAWLVGAIALELVVLIGFAGQLQAWGPRSYVALVLLIVALHFIVMAPAYGPPALLLAATCGANAALALAWAGYPTAAFTFVDGLLKAAIGFTMCFASPVLARAEG